MLYLTPIFVMLYLTRDIWHRHSVFTPVLSIYTDTWHVTLDILFMTLALGIYTGTQYIDPVLDLCHTWHLALTPGIWYAFCGTNTLTWHHDPWPDTTTPDTCIISLLRGLGMIIIFTRHLVFLNSCTPVYLNPWNREAHDFTPNIILLLTPP